MSATPINFSCYPWRSVTKLSKNDSSLKCIENCVLCHSILMDCKIQITECLSLSRFWDVLNFSRINIILLIVCVWCNFLMQPLKIKILLIDILSPPRIVAFKILQGMILKRKLIIFCCSYMRVFNDNDLFRIIMRWAFIKIIKKNFSEY